MPAKEHKAKADKPHQTEVEPGDHEHPQNHGWYVSQAAHDKSVSGHEHGQAVSEVARGDSGKPDAADH